jgi:hypothetical protein
MRPFLARRQHNSPVLNIGIQGITCPNIESAAKRAWKNDLPFRRNFGLHGKTILPDFLFFRNRSYRRKGQEGVRRALEEIGRALPFPLRGIDSDNGSEFINAHLYGYCRSRAIQFTRGRPYKKDDNAHIEQKNWTHVRRLLGYVRYDSQPALEAINDLYANELGLFRNLFLPSVKLVRKVRVGSRTRRIYGKPQTPSNGFVPRPPPIQSG